MSAPVDNNNTEQFQDASLLSRVAEPFATLPDLGALADAESLTFPTLRAFGKSFPLTLTRTELTQKTHQTVNALRSAGLSAGDTVSILLPTIPQAYMSVWAAQAVGIAHPLNPSSSAERISAEVAAAQPKAIITLAPLPGINLWDKTVVAVKNTSSVDVVFYVDLRTYLPSLNKIAASIYLWKNESMAQSISTATLVDFDQFIERQPIEISHGMGFAAKPLESLFE